MPVGHTHQRTGVEAEEKESLMLELEAFAAKDFSESGAAGVAPFRFMVASCGSFILLRYGKYRKV
jgi:hypothetical protein